MTTVPDENSFNLPDIISELYAAAAELWEAEQAVQKAKDALAEAHRVAKAADRRLVKASPWSPDSQSFICKLAISDSTLMFTVAPEADGEGFQREVTIEEMPLIRHMAEARLAQHQGLMDELSVEGDSDA